MLLMDDLAVLVLHGFTAQPKTVAAIEPYLQQAGLIYEIPALRGHGGTPTDLFGVKWQDWVADGLSAYQHLQSKAKRVAVVGHSMGGLVATHIAAKNPVDSLVLAAAAFRFSNPLAPLVGLMSAFVKIWHDPGAVAAITDEQLRQYYKENPVTYDHFPTKAFAELWQMAKITQALLPEIKSRTLVIHSLNDKTIPKESSEMILSNINSKEKSVEWLNRSSHEMFCDVERDVLCKMIVDFVSKPVA